MNIPVDIIELIDAEQEFQCGKFYPDSVYLDKIYKNAELIVHKSQGKTIGFVFFYCNSKTKYFSYITLIATSKAKRGTGIGYSLVNQVLFISKQRGFKECHLEVRKSNKSALAFYQRIGFNIIEDRYEKLLMVKAT